MAFWEKVKKDLQKGIKDGITIAKEGAAAVRHRAEELTEEGKRRYQIYELKTKVQKEITELGGRVYDLSSSKQNPMLDKKVTAITSRIGKLEKRIEKLERATGAKKKISTGSSAARRPRGTSGRKRPGTKESA